MNELISRLILIIRIVKADTVVCWDPWAHDEENPDHYMLARGVEAACWMAGRAHDYPEQFAAGLEPHAVADKYYFARRPEITRIVDISAQIDKKVEVNQANSGKGPAGHLGSRLRAELAKQGKRLPVLGNGDDVSADRNYIKEFGMRGSRELGAKYGVEYAEAFHYLPAGSAAREPIHSRGLRQTARAAAEVIHPPERIRAGSAVTLPAVAVPSSLTPNPNIRSYAVAAFPD